MPTTMAGFCSEKNLALMQDFFGNRDEKYRTDLDRRVEIARFCIDDREYNYAALMEFLAQYDD